MASIEANVSVGVEFKKPDWKMFSISIMAPAMQALGHLESGDQEKALEMLREVRRTFEFMTMPSVFMDKLDDEDEPVAAKESPVKAPVSRGPVAEGLTPIPRGVHYSVGEDAFYSTWDGRLLGSSFHETWDMRRHEFPCVWEVLDGRGCHVCEIVAKSEDEAIDSVYRTIHVKGEGYNTDGWTATRI